jgi:hypothetical protein
LLLEGLGQQDGKLELHGCSKFWQGPWGPLFFVFRPERPATAERIITGISRCPLLAQSGHPAAVNDVRFQG